MKKLLVGYFAFAAAIPCIADGLDSWSLTGLRYSDTLNTCVYGEGNFVAAAYNYVLVSTNGADWERRTTPTYSTCGAAFGNGTYVFTHPVGFALASTNLINWSKQRVTPSADLGWFGAAYLNGRFVLVGNGATVATATNIDFSCDPSGTQNCSWAVSSLGVSTNRDDDLGGAAFGNGVYVAAGGRIALTSADASVWTKHGPITTNYLYDVAFGNGVFVAVGRAILTSTDGVSWTDWHAGDGSVFYRVTFGNGVFVAVGWDVSTSTDGVVWRKRRGTQENGLYGIAYGRGKFVAVGGGYPYACILESGPIFSLGLCLTNDGCRLQLTGEPGRAYRIQATTNSLESGWFDRFSFTNVTETMELLDVTDTASPQRFYRALSP